MNKPSLGQLLIPAFKKKKEEENPQANQYRRMFCPKFVIWYCTGEKKVVYLCRLSVSEFVKTERQSEDFVLYSEVQGGALQTTLARLPAPGELVEYDLA